MALSAQFVVNMLAYAVCVAQYDLMPRASDAEFYGDNELVLYVDDDSRRQWTR